MSYLLLLFMIEDVATQQTSLAGKPDVSTCYF